MPQTLRRKWLESLGEAKRQLRRPEYLAFLPALTLAAYWFGGEAVLILTALGLPLLFFLMGAVRISPRLSQTVGRSRHKSQRGLLIARLDSPPSTPEEERRQMACLLLQIDDLSEITALHGPALREEALERVFDRLQLSVRGEDVLIRLGAERFALVPDPRPNADLDTLLHLAARLQATVSEPIVHQGARLHLSGSVGFCLASRLKDQSGGALLKATELAVEDALQNGPGAIRAYSKELETRRANRRQLREELETALNEGQIIPYFQPQISAATGEITGMEALARWHHPERGLIPPMDFLPLIETAGLSERLGEVILFGSLTALSCWDAAGLSVPNVGVNFSQDQLRNPRLAEILKWELDRFDLTPERLSVEILETVVAETDNDVVVRNIAALSQMGCGIDLDDFGTGHASIATIRRFAIRRIKIDRSFVTRVDSDQNQQRMLSAILSMAERLGLETLAEGVETRGEQETLAQLCCRHLQGFGIARPMTFEAAQSWLSRHHARAAGQEAVGRYAV